MRLIDEDALSREMYRKSFEVDDGRQKWNSGLWIRYKIYEESIRDAPTVDAVPVVRCKDCKYKYTDGDNVVANYCLLNHNRVQPDEWFCADAEREEE